MEKTFKAKSECASCKGTGLYKGMGEQEGAAVVCHRCKGTGCYEIDITYTPFTKRKKTDTVKRVYQHNPGIGIGEVPGKLSLEDFGGMPYKDWDKGEKFSVGSEMRKFVCPAWWYQSVDYSKKPNWKECIGIGSFSSCPYLKTKERCWKKWDELLGPK